MTAITNLQAVAIGLTFAYSIREFQVLDKSDNKLRTYKKEQDMNNLLALKKYKVEPQKDKTDLCHINPKQLDCDHYKINKLIADRKLCYRVFLDTYRELSMEKTYSPLTECIQTIHNQNNYLLSLTEDEARNVIVRRNIARELRIQRNRRKSALYDITILIENLLTRIKDAMQIENAKTRYLDNWQASRAQQNVLYIKQNEDGVSKAIMFYRKKHEEEQRIHHELEILTNMQVNETLHRLDLLLAKYETDIEQMEVKIQRIRSYYEDKRMKREGLEKKLADRDKAINEWLQFKNDREKTRLCHLKMNEAAVIVQAWWRGLLVRLELGKYKKKITAKQGNKSRIRLESRILGTYRK